MHKLMYMVHMQQIKCHVSSQFVGILNHRLLVVWCADKGKMWNVIFNLILLNNIGLTVCCRFGPYPNCGFPCRCSGSNQCDSATGQCAPGSQCQNVLPDGFGWRGPGCLIGNVAYNKHADQSGTWSYYSAELAIDGDTNPYITTAPGESCAHPLTTDGLFAWWWVDLEDMYNIQSVTIVNRRTPPGFSNLNHLFDERFTDFDIKIGNTSDRSIQTLCFHQDKNGTHVKAVETIVCDTGDIVGRYVSFTRTGGEDPNQAHFCEFIVIGHKFIVCDAEHCNGECSPVTGCETCTPGKMLPDCKTDCPDGYWGVNCANNCGRCIEDVVCDTETGSCGEQCEGWYMPDLCIDTLPESPQTSNMMILDITENSARLSWIRSAGFPSDIQQYFYYIVKHKNKISDPESWRTSDKLSLSDEYSVQYDLSGLDYNTEYEVQIVSQRALNGLTETGNIHTLQFKTKCTDPVIQGTPIIFGSPKLFMTKWKSVIIEDGCDFITKQQLSIECHYSTHLSNETMSIPVNDTSFFYSAEYAAICYLRLILTNNAGLSATSLPVSVKDDSETISGSTMITNLNDEPSSTMVFQLTEDADNIKQAAIASGVVAIVIILAMGAVIVVLIIRLRSAQQKPCENVYVNDSTTHNTGTYEGNCPHDDGGLYENTENAPSGYETLNVSDVTPSVYTDIK